MAGHYMIGRARSAGFAWALAIFSPLVLVAALVLFRLSVLDLATLSWSLLVAGTIGTGGLFCALIACAIVWQTGRSGGGRAVSALTVAAIAVLPFVAVATLYAQYPTGNGAATTGLSETLSDLADDAAPLVGRDFQAPAPIVYGAARTAMADGGMRIVEVGTTSLPRPAAGDLGVSGSVPTPIPTPRDSVDLAAPFDRFAGLDATDYTIRAVALVPVLRLPSDVLVRIQEEGGRTYVDATSRSQTVPLDLGENRRIVERFLARLDAAMDVLEGVTPEE